MKRGIYIQSNNKQLLGAKIAKFAMETRGKADIHGIPVTIVNVEDIPVYMAYAGITYKRGNETRVLDPNDLQFFTLSRFMPPELMGYEGRALVIDPDIFALSDITALFDMDLGEAAIAACSKKDSWDTSAMLLDCSKLKHWNIRHILEGLKKGSENYADWMQLKNEHPVPLSRVWNSLDELTPETKMLHTTRRLTQPWKTGLPVDFHINIPPKLFGIISRVPLLKLRGKWPTHYTPHPNKNIDVLFFELAREALNVGAISELDIKNAIQNKDVRPDLLTILKDL